MKNRNNILDNIKAIRAEKGFGQEYMATQLGITQAGYALWEKGRRDLTYNNLLKVAEVLKCDVVELITYPKKMIDPESLPPTTEKKVSITFEVDPQERDHLLKMVYEKHL